MFQNWGYTFFMIIFPCVPVAKKKKSLFQGTIDNLLYIQSKTSVLARNFGALKQTNVPSSAFHKPLDLCECQQYYSPTPVPNPV